MFLLTRFGGLEMDNAQQTANGEQAEFEKLHAEYKAFVLRERVDWLRKNPPPTNECYEVMSPRDQNEVHTIVARWGTHITPLTEEGGRNAVTSSTGRSVQARDVTSPRIRVEMITRKAV